MRFLLSILLLGFMLDGVGQITFEKQLYSHDISQSFSNNIRQTMDGGFVIVGNKNISSTSYGFLMKTNQYGDTTWIKHYKIDGKKLFFNDIILLDDGFLLSGKYQPTNPTNQDTIRTILIKTDLIGEKIWSKKFESPLLNMAFTKIVKTENNEFFILVNSNFHLCLTKMDINGEILWQKKYYTNEIGSSFSTVSQFDIVHSNDELYIVLDDVLFKTNSIGDILWKRQYQNIETGEKINFSSIEKSNNAIILAGTYDFDNGEFKICFVNINTLDFTINWSVYFMDYEGGVVYDLEKTSDNGFIAMHSCSTWGEYESYKILKIDSLGNGLFSRRAGSWTRKVVQTIDNGFAFVGEENWEWDDSQYKFVKTDSAGNTPCWTSFPISENICNLLSFVTGNENIISNSYDTLTNVFVQTLRAGGVDSTLCTSVINTSATLNEVTCNSFTLNNQTYTESGTYYQIFQNYLGFDSTIALNLTINNPTILTLDETACENFTLNNQTYIQSGTYIQTVQNVLGCDSTITLNLTIININPAITNNSNILTAQQTGASYQWIDCDLDAIIPGATNQSFTPTHVGEYAVQITIGNCTETSNCVMVNNVSLEENQLENGFEIFPNPFTSEAKIVFNVPQTNTKIQLLDVLGKELQSVSFSGMEYTLYRESLSASMYFVQMTDASGKVATRKIVLE